MMLFNIETMKQIKTKIRIAVLEKCNSKCAYCGCDLTLYSMQVDHVISRKNYDSIIKNSTQIPSFLRHLTEFDVNHFDNLMASCKQCNIHKASMGLEEFRDKIKSRIEYLNTHLYGANYRLAKSYGLVKEINKPVTFYFERI